MSIPRAFCKTNLQNLTLCFSYKDLQQTNEEDFHVNFLIYIIFFCLKKSIIIIKKYISLSRNLMLIKVVY